ncbi:hypothetical protein DPSP01_012026 [Paraphaeosphaeria sporulosa]
MEGELSQHCLLQNHHRLRCSVKQDAVYGLMGLETKESTVAVEYDKSYEVVEEVVVKACQTGCFQNVRSTMPVIQQLLPSFYEGGRFSPGRVERIFRKAGVIAEWRE